MCYEEITCPRCSSRNIVKNGTTANQKQRYRCKACRQQLEWYIKELETRLSNIERLHAQELAQREKLVTVQQRKITELTGQLKLAEEKLRTILQNSSKPPSSDPPSKAKKLVRLVTGKRRGGQEGHAFHGRKLTPIENVTFVTDHRPARCARCHATLSGDDANPLRH